MSARPGRELLTIAEAAERLGISQRTLRRRIAAGALPVFRDGGVVRVPEVALARYVREHTVGPRERVQKLPRPGGTGRGLPGQVRTRGQRPSPVGGRVLRLWDERALRTEER